MKIGNVPDGEGFFARQGDLKRQYFVYCKENQRSMAKKEPPLGHIDIFQTWPRGPAQDGHFVSIFAHPTPSVAARHLPLTGGVGPRTPITGVTPLVRQNISGAQNLSECLNSRRTTGPWLPQNFSLCGFCSAPGSAEQVATGANPGGRPKGLPYSIPEVFLENRRGGACPSRGPVWDRPLRKEGTVRRRGGIPGLPFFPAVSLRTCGKHGKIPVSEPPRLRF